MPAITVDIPEDLAANFDTPEAIRQALFEISEQRPRIEAAIGDFISVAAPVKVHGFSRNLGQGEQGARTTSH